MRFVVALLFFLLSVSGVSNTAQAISGISVATCSDPDYTVTDYDALRNTTGGEARFAQVTGASIAGCFAWSGANPYEPGGLGGLAIPANDGGYWVRQFSYGPASPLELDWYQLTDGANITDLINDLASTFSPAFYVRMPRTSMTLYVGKYWDFTCNGHALERIRILESDANVVIKSVNADSYRMMAIGNSVSGAPSCSQNVYELVIGTDVDKNDRNAYKLWLDGSQNGPCHNCKAGLGLIGIRPNKDDNYIAHVRVNAKDARGNGLQVVGAPSSGPDNLYVSGRFESAGIQTSGGLKSIVLDDLYYSDPYSRTWGWTGEIKGGVAQTDYQAYGSHNIGIWLVNIGGAFGQVKTEFSGQLWNIHVVEHLGTAGEPLTYIGKNLGFLGDGTPLQKPAGIGVQWGKTDPAASINSSPTAGRRYLKFVNEGSDFGSPLVPLKVAFEATDEACTGNLWHNTHIEVTLVNFRDRLLTGVLGYCDGSPAGLSAHHTFKSDGVNPAMVADKIVHAAAHSTFEGGQWTTIEIARKLFTQGSGGSIYQPCNDNSIRSASITGAIVIDGGCSGTELIDVTWLRSARTVMTIDANADVTASNLSAPKGSTIEGSGTLILDGKHTSLPYTFTGDNNVNAAPTVTGQTVTTTEDEAVGITLEGTDPDGDALSYVIATQPSHGVLSGTAPSLTYTPDSGYTGSDSFTFYASDGSAISNTATVSITVEALGSAPVTQRVVLEPGWNLVALNVIPTDPRIEYLLSDVVPTVKLVKSENGDVYYPEYNLNDIGDWQPDEAYQIFSDGSVAFEVVGERISSSSVPIALDAGWNHVPYVLDQDLAVDSAFESIASALVLAKNGGGSVYYPELGINDIGDLTPGQGYKLYVAQAATLVYP